MPQSESAAALASQAVADALLRRSFVKLRGKAAWARVIDGVVHFIELRPGRPPSDPPDFVLDWELRVPGWGEVVFGRKGKDICLSGRIGSVRGSTADGWVRVAGPEEAAVLGAYAAEIASFFDSVPSISAAVDLLLDVPLSEPDRRFIMPTSPMRKAQAAAGMAVVGEDPRAVELVDAFEAMLNGRRDVDSERACVARMRAALAPRE